jgi:hypothetical protein
MTHRKASERVAHTRVVDAIEVDVVLPYPELEEARSQVQLDEESSRWDGD